MSQNSVSVIVCTQNRLESLKKLLEQLLQQDHKAYEIIVVDDRSSDGTEDYLREMAGNHPDIKSIRIDKTPEHINAKKYALSIGIKNASFDILLLTDDDCLPTSEHWIDKMSSSYKQSTEFVLGYSGYKKQPGILNAFIRFETLWTAIHYLGLTLLKIPYMGVGRNLSYKKSTFLKNKGFLKIQTITGGDDDLFVNANANFRNTNVCLNENAVMVSKPKEELKDFFKQKLRHLSVGKAYKFKHRVLLGLLFLIQILFWFSFIILALTGAEPYVVFGGYILRILCVFFAFLALGKKVREPFNFLYLVVFDLIYCLYYPIIGLIASFSKRIRWI
ncbi:MAG: glycosyltransferase [Bacteroidota bacterium]